MAKFLSADVQWVGNYFKKVAFEYVEFLRWHTAYHGYVFVAEIDIIEELWTNEYCRQDNSKMLFENILPVCCERINDEGLFLFKCRVAKTFYQN